MALKKLSLKYPPKDRLLYVDLKNIIDRINYLIDNMYEDDDVDTALDSYALKATAINTTTPLTGGGTLASSRTIAIDGLNWAGTANYLVGVQDKASDGWEYKSLLGTTNQITVTHAVGSSDSQPYGTITLSLEQDIDDDCDFQLGSLRLNDTNDSNYLSLIWNENDTSNRTLNLLVSGGNRSLTIEGDSLINQDLTTDATTATTAKFGVGAATSRYAYSRRQGNGISILHLCQPLWCTQGYDFGSV